MKNYKNILRSIATFMISLIIYLFIITTFAHFNLFSYKTVSLISFIFVIMLFMYCGFALGKKSNKRGYLSGLVIGIINILLILILALLFRCLPELKSLIYFMILLLSSTLGGMFGINFKKQN